MSTDTLTAVSEDLGLRYQAVRSFTEYLAEPLATEDYVLQTMPDVSPTKWHLAHTTWFFETFVLVPHAPQYNEFHPQYAYLFNSYYIQAGERHCRDKRGYLSRPTVKEVYAYRAYVDEQIAAFWAQADADMRDTIGPLLILGMHHEQQHQELLVTDIKHVLSVNPLRPVYRSREVPVADQETSMPLSWIPLSAGVYEVGYDGTGFHYDNEGPRHKTYIQDVEIASRLVTNQEYLAFMEDGGYQRPELWLSEGWGTVLDKGWSEPFYWERHDEGWMNYTLSGLRPVHPHEPVCHLSYFEADAFARWSGARLPTEFEWEVLAAEHPVEGPFVESGAFHPTAADPDLLAQPGPHQLYGDVWQWTQSSYAPYPGYKPAPGALGEYNGKFMCNQYVLRGASCATSGTHARRTYRNFFPTDACWQFTGLRLARDL